MTFGCQPIPHVQSMIWATDSIGMEILLFPSANLTAPLKSYLLKALPKVYLGDPISKHVASLTIPGINSCPRNHAHAVALEVYATPLMKTAGYEVDAVMKAYHGIEGYENVCKKGLEKGDVLLPDGYWGTNIHPFDTVFAKTNRKIDPAVLRRLTEWTEKTGYSSYDYC